MTDDKPVHFIKQIIEEDIAAGRWGAPGDRVLVFFAGSGTTGEVAYRHGRSAALIDSNEEAMEVMAQRLAFGRAKFHGWVPMAISQSIVPASRTSTSLRD